MKDKQCINCAEYDRCRDSNTSWIFFIIGIIATIAIRIVTVLMHFNTIYGKAAWYIGVGGFFIFFLYKYRVINSRAKIIRQTNLVEKIRQPDRLTQDDYKIVGSILCGLSSKKERINYFFIFGLSAVALCIAIYIDFFK